MHVGEATPFAIGFLALVDVDPIFVDQLLVEQSWIFASFDPAGDVKPVPVSQIADGDLLDQAFGRCGDAAIAFAPLTTRATL